MQEESEERSGLLLMTKLLTLAKDNSRRMMRVSVVRSRCTPIPCMKSRSKLRTLEGGVMPAEIKESLVVQCRKTGGRTS